MVVGREGLAVGARVVDWAMGAREVDWAVGAREGWVVAGLEAGWAGPAEGARAGLEAGCSHQRS